MSWIREDGRAGFHSCFCSVGDCTVVIAQFLSCIIQSEPISVSNSPTPSSHHFFSTFKGELSSPAAKQGYRKHHLHRKHKAVRSNKGKMMGNDVQEKNQNWLGSKYANTHYKDRDDECLGWTELLSNQIAIVFFCLWDIEALESGQ